MFIIMYPVQAAIMVLFTGPLAIITAWMAVLQQSGIVSVFIITYLLMPEIQRVAFDAVLSRECADDVVLLGKLRRVVKVPFLVKCGNFLWKVPTVLILPYTICKALLIFVLSSIPLLGPVIVVLIQAPSKGLQAHARYFALKGYDKKKINEIYKANTGAYMGFGITANLLESIPLFSVFFMFTNTVGAALWVVAIEQEEKQKAENEAANEAAAIENIELIESSEKFIEESKIHQSI
ncbi:uncharacterized protein PRCAT00004131001 [Priceomyces carsonii]|uniref:uncharacterized protein n=1 Tax=Priceomyces carsonii TaxID=28549 RepID=UPI002ED7EEAA|nr:unnamed protein product [Priceomyces carsonii]